MVHCRCILIKNQSDPFAWPCTYKGYPDECTDRSTHAVNAEWCLDVSLDVSSQTYCSAPITCLPSAVMDLNGLQLFEKFDFINMGTSEPVFKWQQGEGPANANCGSASNCDKEIKCAIQNVRMVMTWGIMF